MASQEKTRLKIVWCGLYIPLESCKNVLPYCRKSVVPIPRLCLCYVYVMQLLLDTLSKFETRKYAVQTSSQQINTQPQGSASADFYQLAQQFVDHLRPRN